MSDERDTIETSSDALYHLAELAEAGIAAASLVHEVRQPLFALRTLAQLGSARGPDGRVASMDDVLELVDHLDSLLSAWSDVGRHEEPRLYDVREVVIRVVRMLEGRRRQVRATVDSGTNGASLFTVGSPSAPRQVALNLLLNAFDAVEGADLREVVVELEADDEAIYLSVRDTGPGISAAIADTLFEPFVTTKPADRGTGLGLYVARRLCREHGGDLVVEPPGSGASRGAVLHASFRRTLPSVDP
jgi:two-component system C4-dicarboxylate transport sensor histidine kinase DctB